ncbi:MAG: magnesium-translocating P-type ATPase [Candidatus Obscuribacterales bacterium]|nr:magnesium-translocating P-type ATPase [Candidatus Obscuribacterales bacterium]
MNKLEESGLSSNEAQERLRIYGPNEFVLVHRLSTLLQICSYFTDPLVIILLIASAVSAFVGESFNSLIIATMVLLSVALNFIQSYRAQKAEESLKSQIAPKATVLRDGQWVDVPPRMIVPGDFIQLSAGDLIPADARLIEVHDLHVNEAALTGESFPVEKQVNDSIFLGSSIVSGTAMAVAIATGTKTAFGTIANLLTAKAPESEFERGARRFGILISKTVFVLVLFVLMSNIMLGRDLIQSLLFALALAVGLTPEFLPMIMTVSLGQGAVRMAKQKVIVKHLPAIQNFGSMDVLCSDKTGTLTSGQMVLEVYCDFMGNRSERTLRLSQLNSFYQTGTKNPLDTAILKDVKSDTLQSRKLDEIPFDFERKRLSVVVGIDKECILIAKGAPETILSCCTQCEVTNERQALDEDMLAQCNATWTKLSRQGYRVLAVAYKVVSEQQKSWNRHDERDLVLLGFLAFLDPPLPEVAKTITSLHKDGIKVKILTGDNEHVTKHVCSKVGLNVERLIHGEELDRLTPPALEHIAEKYNVFVRVTPAQKHQLILALKRRGHVVGFLGDGINDSPSLHAADVGISVANAVDVAKDAAEIILLQRDLRILHQGVVEGRKAWGNVIKYLLMGTSSNFGNMFSMAAASLFLPFLPMLPIQIILNNFLYDLAQVTIPSDNVDQTYIRKPHRWNIGSIKNFMIRIGPISSVFDFITFFVLLKFFHANQELFHTGWFVESLATQTLVLFVIRTAGNPFRSRPSKPLSITTLLVVAVGLLLPFTAVARPLGFTALPLEYLVFLVIATATYLLVVQSVKRRIMRDM